MSVSTRQQFIEYCLRNLGAPVLEINVDQDQIEDRIDEAIEYWRLYHHEGIEKIYLKQKFTATRLTIQQSIANTFPLLSIITGQTSGARARVIEEGAEQSAGTTLITRAISGTFVAGESIVADSGQTATLAATNFINVGVMDNKYFDLPDYVYGVSRMIPIASTQTSKSMFDIQYQLRLNDLYDLTSTSIIYYKMVMSHLSLLDLELNGKPMIRFNRLSGRIYPDINWDSDIIPGTYAVFEAYRAMDPTVWPKVWNEPWLKHYATALIKRQWATNLKKFSGVQLPGGVTIDGAGMYAEAMQEIKDLEEELIVKAAPLDFFLG